MLRCRCPATPAAPFARCRCTIIPPSNFYDHQLTVLADLLVHRLQAVKELEALAADVVPHAMMWEEPASTRARRTS